MNDSTLNVLRTARGLVARCWFACETAQSPHRTVGDSSVTSHCVATALGAAEHQLNVDILPAWTLICADIGTTIEGVPKWNNAPERTQAEVVGLFDRVILALEAQEYLAATDEFTAADATPTYEREEVLA